MKKFIVLVLLSLFWIGASFFVDSSSLNAVSGETFSSSQDNYTEKETEWRTKSENGGEKTVEKEVKENSNENEKP